MKRNILSFGLILDIIAIIMADFNSIQPSNNQLSYILVALSLVIFTAVHIHEVKTAKEAI